MKKDLREPSGEATAADAAQPLASAAPAGVAWDALLVMVVAWTAHFALFRRLGFYEDDYWIVADPITWTWQQAWDHTRHLFADLPQGRPFGLFLGSLVPFLVWKVGGIAALPALYLVASAFITVNTLLVHRLLFASYGRTLALLGALVFAVYPADTTRSFLLHAFAVQPAHTFALLALLLYQRGRRLPAYLLAACSLMTYESGMLAFFAAPLLARTWDRALVRRWTGHLALTFGVVALVVLLRYLAGEDRVANYSGSDITGDWREVPSRMLQALGIGPARSLGAFGRRFHHGLRELQPLHLGLRFAIALPLLWVVFFRRTSPALSESRPALVRALVTGLVMYVGGYGLEFSRYHFPPTETYGRLSAVHFGGSIGGSIFAAAVLALLWSLVRGWRSRVTAAGLTAFFVASLWMFGFVVQKGYAASFRHQRAYWKELVALMPDLSERSIVILLGAEPPVTRFILTSSWSDCFVLPLLFRASGGGEPRLVGGYHTFHDGYFEARDGRLWWTEQAPFFLKIDRSAPLPREGVIVLEHGDAGWRRRTGSITFHGVEIPLPPPGEGSPRVAKGPLHGLLLGP